MVEIPDEVIDLFNDLESMKVLVTIDEKNVPHCVPVGSLCVLSPSMIAFGVIMMKKTHSNLLYCYENRKTVVAMAVKGPKSYQVKALAKEYLTDGIVYEKFEGGLKPLISNSDFGLKGVWILEPTEIYNQSLGLNAGQKIA